MRYEDFVLEAGAPAAQLEALRGITEVVGEVSITDAESLEALSCLERVEGWLSVSGPKTLEGLERLERVGGLGLSGPLRNVDALERLTTVDDGLSLFFLPVVEDLQFGIEELGGDIFINDVESGAPFDLAVDGTLEGDLQSVQSNLDLRPFTRRLQHVSGSINLYGAAPSAVDFSGLESVDGVVFVQSEGATVPMPRMESLVRVGHSLVLSNLLAEDMSAFQSLERVGGLQLTGISNLRTLDGLQALRVVEHDGELASYASTGLELYNLPALEDISALAGIERVIGPNETMRVEVGITQCEQLSDLHGLEPWLPWLDHLSLYMMPAIVDLTSLSSATRMPGLKIEATGITSLAGVNVSGPWFRRLDGRVDLWLSDNPDLVDLMPAIATAEHDVPEPGFVIIEGNTSLSHCEAEAFIEAAQAQGFDGATSNKDSLDDTPCDR